MTAFVEVLVVWQVYVRAGGAFAHQSLKLRKVVLVDSPWGRLLVLADAGRHTDHFAHHRSRSHKPCRAKRDMGGRDVPASHEQVVYIPGIQAPVWCGIWIDRIAFRGCLELIPGEIGRVCRIREMEIEMPGQSKGSVLVKYLFINIILLQDIISDKPAGLPLARDIGNPTEGTVGVFSLL